MSIRGWGRAGSLMMGLALAGCGGSRRPVEMPPYFSYTPDEIHLLSLLTPQGRMATTDLYEWDQKAFDLVSGNKMGDINAAKAYAYLSTAQADAAFLSLRAKGELVGSFAPITRDVLCLFFPRDCPPGLANPDPYSEKISAIVLAKVRARILEDDRAVKTYEEKSGKLSWKGFRPYYGQDVGSWKTWNIDSPADFMAAAPAADDTAEMKEQLERVNEALGRATESQKNAVVFWAGGPGTKTPPGQWLEIADESLSSRGAPLEKVLVVRSMLTRAIADAVIVAFHNKYTYWKRRPFMINPAIHTIMPTPNHPSYPAAHGTISGAAATVLAHYIPEEAQVFKAKATEANNSRLWGGIHFPRDNDQGLMLGEQSARKGLEKAAR